MQKFAPWGFSAEQLARRIESPRSPSCITQRCVRTAGCACIKHAGQTYRSASGGRLRAKFSVLSERQIKGRD